MSEPGTPKPIDWSKVEPYTDEAVREVIKAYETEGRHLGQVPSEHFVATLRRLMNERDAALKRADYWNLRCTEEWRRAKALEAQLRDAKEPAP